MKVDFLKKKNLNHQASKQIYWQESWQINHMRQVKQVGTANKGLRNNQVAAIKSKKGYSGEDGDQLSYSFTEPKQKQK